MANRRRDVKFHNCKYSQIQRHLPMTCPSKAFHISRSLFVLSNSSALEFSAQNLAGLFCLPKKVQKQFFKTFLELRSMCSQGKKTNPVKSHRKSLLHLSRRSHPFCHARGKSLLELWVTIFLPDWQPSLIFVLCISNFLCMCSNGMASACVVLK